MDACRDPDTGLSRRDLIKRAAAAGTVAWTAPLIVDSLASPAGAVTMESGCFKYMYDWRWAVRARDFGFPSGKPQNDASNCSQNFGESQFPQEIANPNCCEDKAPRGPGGNGNVLEWPEHPDSVGCIQVSSTQPCATSTTNYSVTFTVDPSCRSADPALDCRITDGMVAVDEYAKLNDPSQSLGPSISGFASSKLVYSVTIDFTSVKVPIWFKLWVACGLDPNHPQNDGYFPDTDCQFFASDSTTIS